MNQLKVTLVKSLIDRPESHKRVARALGLRRRGAVRIHRADGVTRGMVFKIRHLVKVEEM
uniref:50S ribosomal protein L30 n=1 Tax=candidate division WOR-3 bacterium TaxID=2052148 RepID=A0A7C4CDA6_UNCW3